MTSSIGNLLIRASRLHRTAAGQLLRDAGLHAGQELLMMHLWDHGSQRQGDLSEVLDVDASTLTRMVQRLEHAGFVRRSRCEIDGRAWDVHPTQAGLALRDRVLAAWEELEKITLNGLSEEEVAALTSALERVGGNLCEFARNSGSPDHC
ncbi:MarR family winged helix-turn-helix transcriptional regulator [Allokutzneria albata]|uniref:DNA-binding transcriptional regulator, MarR family n=1 Tax=Allokutzneria albata TaxID=211114 RepID=A0A1G9TIF4_ALLAB|nr:MarR family transcriptional regulator [Allokutzneria albata]SDM47569.1 DNA-binding transcriptional regulator, MarR family [Allokutzneria albata]